MKKNYSITLNAQTVIGSDNFDGEDVSDWTFLNEDEDGYNWHTVQTINGGNPVTLGMKFNSYINNSPVLGR